VITAAVLTVALVGPQAGTLPRGSLQEVTLRLSSNRTTYYVGEPLQLTLTVRNDGSDGAWGYLTLADEETEIEYRRSGKGFTRFGQSRSEAPSSRFLPLTAGRFPLVLKPGEEARSQIVLVEDPPFGGQLVLGQPGTYEFRVVCRPRPRSAERLMMESDVLQVRVEAPPVGQEEVLADYVRSNLPPFVWAAEGLLPRDPTALKRAAEFIDRHPSGPYSQHVREALLKALRFRVRREKPTEEERQLFDRLRADAPSPEPR
jgi:hypothetical protein